MSRIYQALKQSNESDRVLRLIDDQREEPAEQPARAPARLPEPKLLATSVLSSPSEYRVVSARILAGAPILPFDGTDDRAAEDYRMLRTHLVQHTSQLKVIIVTSATPGDGKTVTALNLAAAMALSSDVRVLVVDADLRRSSMPDVLGIQGSPGLADVLRGDCTLTDAIVRVSQIPRLCVLPAGRALINPAELLDSTLCKDVFSELRERFSYVIVDTTPMSVLADFKLLYQVCDGFLMVVRPDHTDRRSFVSALQMELKNKFLGVVINSCEDWLFWKTNEHYPYYSGVRKEGLRGR